VKLSLLDGVSNLKMPKMFLSRGGKLPGYVALGEMEKERNNPKTPPNDLRRVDG